MRIQWIDSVVERLRQSRVLRRHRSGSIRALRRQSTRSRNAFEVLEDRLVLSFTQAPGSPITGFGGQAVAIADLNGDGKPDIVAGSGSTSGLKLFFGTGGGSFSAAANITLGFSPASIAIGDFNGDTIPDLAIVNKVSDVKVLLGTGSADSNAFGAATTFATGNFATQVAIGEINGDGKPDLVVVNQNDGTVSVLLGSGTGTFGTQTTFRTNVSATNVRPYSVVIGDFNGDGKPDLAVSNLQGGVGDFGDVSVLLNSTTPAATTPTFATTTNFSAGAERPVYLASRDFNGDGHLDLAVVLISGTGGVSVLLGTGTGSFGTATNFSTGGSSQTQVVIGDINGDGKPDLVTSFGTFVKQLLGTGDGSFGSSTTAFNAGGENVQALAIADVNGDGKPDLISITQGQYGRLSIQLNTTPPSVKLSVSSNTGSEADQTQITVTATATSAVSGAQTVSLAVSGTGITSGDFTLSNTTITIPNGMTIGTVTFTVQDDLITEVTETARLTISSPSAGVTLGSPTFQDIEITDNDTPPVLDLNGANDSGSDFTAAFVEGAGAMLITDTDATITYLGSEIVSLTLVVSANPDGAAESLAIAGVTVSLNTDSSGTGTVGTTLFQVGYVAASRTVTVTKNGGGTAPVADFQSLLRGITYNNTSDDPNTTTRTLTVTANDGIFDSDAVTSSVTVAATNDAPTITGTETSASRAETDTTLTATGTLNVVDVDLADQVTITVDSVDVDVSSTFAGTNPLTNAQLKAMLVVAPTTALAANSTAGSDFTWTFTSGASGNGAFNFLHQGETLVLNYVLKGTDDGTSPLSDSQTVTITVTGTTNVPMLANEIVDQSVPEGDSFAFQVPATTFAHADETESLTLTAKRSNGSELPTWLHFDSSTNTFSGTPQSGDVGILSVTITATDTSGATASDTFDLAVLGAGIVTDPMSGITTISDVGGASNDQVGVALSPDALSLVLTVEGVRTTIPLAGLTNLVFNGGDGDDTLTVDLRNGPLPFDITFNGGSGGDDTLIVSGFGNSGLFTAYTANYFNRFDGSIQFRNGDTILAAAIYTGLEPISLDGTPEEIVFNLPDTNNSNVHLLDIGGADGIMQLTGGTFETTNFSIDTATSITINGNSGKDWITIDSVDDGYSGQLIVNGGVGNDLLDASASNIAVSLNGEAGNDTLIGSHDNDTLTGGSGSDLLNGGDGIDTVVETSSKLVLTDTKLAGSNRGIDKILKSIEQAVLIGTDGRDFLDASKFTLGNVTLLGNGGNDTLIGGAGDDSLDGGEGTDLVRQFSKTDQTLSGDTDSASATGAGSDDWTSIEEAMLTVTGNTGVTIDASEFSGNTTLVGGKGNDELLGGSGSNVLKGNAGDDLLVGGDSDDTILGGAGNDQLYGNGGEDSLRGQGGIDTMLGGDDDDRMYGDAGRDVMLGGNGNDTMDGGADWDALDGEGDDDLITGGSGNDTIVGGTGNNTLKGGGGRDRLIGGDDDNRFIASNSKITPGDGTYTLKGKSNRIDDAFTFDIHDLLV